MQDPRTRVRIAVIGLTVVSLFAVLVVRLYYLQVLAGDEFAERATRNYLRIVAEEGPRGRILDRNGKVLVANRTALAVGIRKKEWERLTPAEITRVKARLVELLDIPLSRIERTLKDRRTSPYKAAIVADDVPEEIIFAIRERQAEFPGIVAEMLPVRTYPYGETAAHILGYVGETNERELAELEGYRLGDTIGRTGVERQYEDDLRGVTGFRKLEIDASGRILRTIGARDAKPGNDVVLALDIEAQQVAEAALEAGIKRARGVVHAGTKKRFKAPAGATVVLDPNTGEVIAMASYPEFDPRRFVGGVDDAYYAMLNDPKNERPLLNRATQAAYPPGSTYKPIIALAALASKTGTPRGQYPCRTEFEFGDRIFRNWQPRSGTITIAQSLIESCDTVYYNFARTWWLRERAQAQAGKDVYEIMQDWARRFGLGANTQIDLPGEDDGRIPDRSFYRDDCYARPNEYRTRYRDGKSMKLTHLCERTDLLRGGDAVNMSIGQGEILATPLQMAVVYAALANGGRVLQPHVALRVQRPDGTAVRRMGTEVRQIVKDADPEMLGYVRSALRNVPIDGTAKVAFRGWPFSRIPVAAKTGSSEIAGRQPYSWFGAFAPSNKPKYAVVTVVEEGGSGGQTAGPVVRRIMDSLFELKAVPLGGARSD
jgi:penicillin-binding protein 2